MKAKSKSLAAMAVVLSLLVTGVVPVMALVNQQTATTQSGASTSASASTTTTSSTTSTTTSNQVVDANELIQLAQASQAYAEQLVTLAQQDGVNVTQAQTLISQGSALLTKSEGELGSNSTQAAIDAISAMKDFRQAAQSLQSGIITSVQTSNEVAYLQRATQRAQNFSSELQTVVTKACSSSNASKTVCSDATTNLAQANADITNATSIVASIGTAANQTAAISEVMGLLKDAQSHFQKVEADLNELATSAREAKAVGYVQNDLLPLVTQLQQKVQNSNLSSTTVSNDDAQLKEAQTLLDGAISSFQAGNFTAGIQQVTSATAVLLQVQLELHEQIAIAEVQNVLEPRLSDLQQMAQKANLTSSEAEQVQSQLSQAQPDLTTAVSDFQSGNFGAGTLQVTQAMQLMGQVAQELASVH